MGESASASSTFQSCGQCTPSARLRERAKAFPKATPIKEPIKQCELELGRPSHQVPMFHDSAAMNSDTSIATAGPLSGGDSTSAGSNSTSASATAIPPQRTPTKFI